VDTGFNGASLGSAFIATHEATCRTPVLSWQAGMLDHDLTYRGNVAAKLWASTTGSDADWIVKLIDVYPDDVASPELRGRQLIIADEVFRGRYLASFEHPWALVPGQVVPYSIDAHCASRVFKKVTGCRSGAEYTVLATLPRSPSIWWRARSDEGVLAGLAHLRRSRAAAAPWACKVPTGPAILASILANSTILQPGSCTNPAPKMTPDEPIEAGSRCYD
jgi:X-Pro dipeptidyl-peptidase-like protein